jgi:hypothetical protein
LKRIAPSKYSNPVSIRTDRKPRQSRVVAASLFTVLTTLAETSAAKNADCRHAALGCTFLSRVALHWHIIRPTHRI